MGFPLTWPSKMWRFAKTALRITTPFLRIVIYDRNRVVSGYSELSYRQPIVPAMGLCRTRLANLLKLPARADSIRKRLFPAWTV